MAESKIKFPKQFIGPSYSSRVARFDSQRTVNLYLEKDMSGTTGKNDEVMSLIGMPGLKLIKQLSNYPIRGIYTDSVHHSLYVVSGANVYKFTGKDLYKVEPVLIGTLLTTSGFVSIVDNGIQLVIVDGQYGYYSVMANTAANLTQIIDPNFFASDMISFQDGYFICNKTDTGYFFISDLYSIDFLPLNEANKSGNSDNIIATISNNRELYLLGQNTIETWWDSGTSGSTPFTREDGKFSQIGCVSAGSVARLFNTFMFLGSSPEGGNVVYMMENSSPVRVSNHAVEYSLQSSKKGQYSTAYTWQVEGHYFYALSIPDIDTTWVYDLSTQQWTEQQSNINGRIGRHMAQHHAVYNNMHIVGDYRTGNLYQYDFDTYTDNGNPITRLRQTPHVSINMNKVFYKLFELDFVPGTGLSNGSTNQVNPTVYLEISNDGGCTWLSPLVASIGAVGKYLTRARWARLGSSRDRVFRVTCSDPVRFDILSCFLDAEVGQA